MIVALLALVGVFIFLMGMIFGAWLMGIREFSKELRQPKPSDYYPLLNLSTENNEWNKMALQISEEFRRGIRKDIQ